MRSARRRSVLTATTSLLILTGSLPLAEAAHAETALPYCRYDLTSQALTCASTPEGLNVGVTTYATSYLLARLYDDADRTGVFYEITGAAPCDSNADVDASVANIGSAWNDRVSSFQGYSSCEIRVYENASYTGASYGAFASSNYVGDPMNDRTTSVRLY